MKVLFLGDSITDTGRNTNNGSLLSIGQGYALIASAKLSVKYPGKFEFVNLGVSGNRIVDVYARIKADCWNLQPDVISILIGVNDVWHEFGAGKNGVDAERFYNVYKMLIEDTMKKLPGVRFLLMEPFCLKGSGTENYLEEFKSEVSLRAQAVRRLADEFNIPFVSLQEMFENACEICPAEYWLGDGVHPAIAGHQLIADEWLKAFEAKII